MGFYRQHLQPRLLDKAMGSKGGRAIRARVCSDLAGDVVEIGFGSGRNLPFLPQAVRGVSAVEPSELGLRLSRERQAASGVPVVVGGADAQAMPFADATFDAALSTWTLCGIEDPVQALREVRRVLKPGATLHFVEHGLASDPGVARWQRRGNGLNRRIAGCLLDRDIPRIVQEAGFTLTTLETYYEPGAPKPAGFTYEGHARS